MGVVTRILFSLKPSTITSTITPTSTPTRRQRLRQKELVDDTNVEFIWTWASKRRSRRRGRHCCPNQPRFQVLYAILLAFGQVFGALDVQALALVQAKPLCDSHGGKPAVFWRARTQIRNSDKLIWTGMTWHVYVQRARDTST